MLEMVSILFTRASFPCFKMTYFENKEWLRPLVLEANNNEWFLKMLVTGLFKSICTDVETREKKNVTSSELISVYEGILK